MSGEAVCVSGAKTSNNGAISDLIVWVVCSHTWASANMGLHVNA